MTLPSAAVEDVPSASDVSRVARAGNNTLRTFLDAAACHERLEPADAERVLRAAKRNPMLLASWGALIGRVRLLHGDLAKRIDRERQRERPDQVRAYRLVESARRLLDSAKAALGLPPPSPREAIGWLLGCDAFADLVRHRLRSEADLRQAREEVINLLRAGQAPKFDFRKDAIRLQRAHHREASRSAKEEADLKNASERLVSIRPAPPTGTGPVAGQNGPRAL